MVKFEMVQPHSLQEACEFLHSHEEESKLKAAGVSLLILLKQRLFSPRYLVNLERIPGLDYARTAEDGSLRVGPLTTHRQLETSALVARQWPVLREMELELGSVQLRNRATIGGCLCHSEPLSDPPPLMVALEATAHSIGVQGEREIPFGDFFRGYYENALAADEILREISIPRIPPRTAVIYKKHTLRRAMDKPYVGVAVFLQLAEQEPICREARVVLGALRAAPLRASGVENALKGARLDPAAIEEASRQLEWGEDLVYDLRCPEEYKRQVTPVIIKRALLEAFSRATGRGSGR